MAFSYVTTNGTGYSPVLAVPFPYLAKSHIHVSINEEEVPASGILWVTDASIQLSASLGDLTGEPITVRRVTPAVSAVSVFEPGSLDHRDLNNAIAQTLYVMQEVSDAFGERLGADVGGDFFDARGLRISNVKDGIKLQDAVTLGQLQSAFNGQITPLFDAFLASLPATQPAEPGKAWLNGGVVSVTDYSQ